MTTDDLQLLREFRAGIPVPDEETRRRIYAQATRPRRIWLRASGHSPARAALVVAVGLIAVAAMGFGVSTLVQGSGHPRSGTAAVAPGPGALRPGITTLGNDNPFGADGKLVSLQQLVAEKAKEGYTLPVPDSPLANSDNVGNVWENTATGEVIIYYPSSGIELNYGGTGLDYSGIPANDIQTINGIRAIVFPAGSPESYFSSVALPIPSGHALTLLSKGPVSDLVSVAKTMTATTDGSGTGDALIGGVFLIPDTGQIGSSVELKTEVPFANATLDIEVRRALNSSDPYSEQGQVVFKETVPMTNMGTEAALSTWVGTLSVNDWTGGCQSNANYGIAANARNSAGVIASRSTSHWFTCKPGA